MKPLGTNEPERHKVGWYYAHETLAEGIEYFSYPVLLIGHGVLGPVTGVLYDKKTGKALVVQADVHQMCGEGFRDRFADAPFCSDLGAAVKRIPGRPARRALVPCKTTTPSGSGAGIVSPSSGGHADSRKPGPRGRRNSAG